MIIDGKQIANQIQTELKQKIGDRKPVLGVILVGANPASQIYVHSKRKACAEIGIESRLLTLSATISETDLIRHIQDWNHNPEIHGILVQFPLPHHISSDRIAASIAPEKDVDGFNPVNAGKLLLGHEDGFIPCTPLGVHALLKKTNISIEGSHVVIVGRSNLVGKPLAALLMQKKPHCNATVTVAHSQSKHLAALTRSADILIAAIGSPHFIKKEMVKPGACVIDVGINRLEGGKIVGDVDFETIAPIASHITPVPKGVGPMTIAMLLTNTLKAYDPNCLL